MPLDHKAIIKQIDDILAKYKRSYDGETEIAMVYAMMVSALRRFSPPGSSYAASVRSHEDTLASHSAIAHGRGLDSIYGILRGLRSDYAAGYLQSVVELVHAGIFADFLEMSAYLLEQGYKDAAAVIAGSVLEEHLRKLCDKNSIIVVKPDGAPKKADTLNAELAGADVYSKLELKGVTFWLDLRNKAAHGKYSEYTQEQVTLMIQGVRDFASRYPA